MMIKRIQGNTSLIITFAIKTLVSNVQIKVFVYNLQDRNSRKKEQYYIYKVVKKQHNNKGNII